MGKGANNVLLSNAGTGQGHAGGLMGQGSQISQQLVPELQSEANNPQGYTPQQMAYMNTASQQSLGGSTGGVTGQANLQAARTRNAGGFQGAVASGSRSNARQLSQNAVQIQANQANLQQQQRQQALSALQSLYGVDESTALGYLNQSDSAALGYDQGTALMDKNFWNNVSSAESLAGNVAGGVGGVAGGGG